MCVNPELDAKEIQTKTATEQATAEVQSKTNILEFAKRASNEIRFQSDVIQALKLKFENCHLSAAHKIACADAQLGLSQVAHQLEFRSFTLLKEAETLPEKKRADFVIQISHLRLITKQFVRKFGLPK